MEPDFFQVCNSLGIAYRNQKDIDNAIYCLEKASKYYHTHNDPKKEEVDNMLSMLHDKL